MPAPPDPPYHNVDWKDDLEKAPRAAEFIYLGSLRVELWLREKATRILLDRSIMEGIHRVIFMDVFPDFAGRLRGEAPRYVPQNVEFGLYRGVLYEKVVEMCDEMFLYTKDYIRELDRYSTSMGREEFTTQLVRVAAYVHCEMVRIHPFRNGNGRVARSCVNYFARRYGFQPMPFDRPSGAYLPATNAWHDTKKADKFEEFLRPLLVRIPDPDEQ